MSSRRSLPGAASLWLRLALAGSLGVSAAGSQVVGAQSASMAKPIPVRKLPAPHAVSSDTLSPRIVARGLSNGSVLVAVFALQGLDNQRFKLFDSTLEKVTLVMDSLKQPQLIRFTGDSSLAIDQRSASFLVLDAKGNVARIVQLPRQLDIQYFTDFTRTGAADPKGRLAYRIGIPRVPQSLPEGEAVHVPQSDSLPIVRADFEKLEIDTLIRVSNGHQSEMWITQTSGSRTMKVVVNPFSYDDEWAMLADGTIAVVRMKDYLIDWVDPDGTRRSTPTMNFNPRRLTTEEKQRKIDSLTLAVETANNNNKRRNLQTPNPPNPPNRTTITSISYIPIDSVPDYEPAVMQGSVRADLDGNLWIIPRAALATQEGPLYDVVNRKGEIIDRVQFPKGRVLAGFGPGGIAYLNRVEGNVGFLERVKIRQ